MTHFCWKFGIFSWVCLAWFIFPKLVVLCIPNGSCYFSSVYFELYRVKIMGLVHVRNEAIMQQTCIFCIKDTIVCEWMRADEEALWF